jgi:hypothetical protein
MAQHLHEPDDGDVPRVLTRVTPAASISSPPMPDSSIPGCSSRSARASPAPSRSPDASPAEITMRSGRLTRRAPEGGVTRVGSPWRRRRRR